MVQAQGDPVIRVDAREVEKSEPTGGRVRHTRVHGHDNTYLAGRRAIVAFAVSIWTIILIVIAACIVATGFFALPPSPDDHEKNGTLPAEDLIPLPAPKIMGTVSVEEAISGRRSVREYTKTPLTISDLSQLLWAAQGLTDPSGLRATPSAGALYPLEIYAACGNVNGLSGGVYHYLPQSHALDRVIGRDVREDLYRSALRQPSVRDAAAVIIIAADYNRTTKKYGEQGIRYVHMEAGHASENIYLQAYALGIGTVAIGAFDDNGIMSLLGFPHNQTPLYLMPIGKVSTRAS
ncbi:MAG: SagB/ThcOx family dehydrogenase [Methanoregula sp.]|nr:SagB/ThcOx family dehydrogenase [Methanoregula sp.]